MMRKLLALLLALSFVLTAVPVAADTPSTEQVYARLRQRLEGIEDTSWSGLTHREMLADFDYLYGSLVDNYPYFGVVRRTTGVDLHQSYREIRERIPSMTSDKEYLLAVYDYIEQAGGAGHLSMSWFDPDESSPAFYRGAYDRVAPYYRQAQQEYAQVLGLDRSGSNVTTRIIEEGNIAYVRIDSFQNDYYDEDKEILLDFYRQVADYDHLIIDITSNGGGSMGYYFDLIVGPNIQKPVLYHTFGFLKGGELNRQHLIGRGTTIEQSYLPISKSPRESLPTLQERWGPYMSEAQLERSLGLAEQQTWPPSRLNPSDFEDFDYYSFGFMSFGPQERIFAGDIWVLVSGSVYSSSESFAIMCKQTGFATLVGTQTGGDGIGIDPVNFSLPHSGLWIRYAPIYGTTVDGRGSEEYGTTPDIVSPAGEDALTTCLKAIHAAS